MKHEKVIKREDGTQYQICVSLHADSFRNKTEWRINVYTRSKGKRNWSSICHMDSYDYRKLSMEERAIYEHDQQLLHVTEQEVLEAKLELWNQLKPTL